MRRKPEQLQRRFAGLEAAHRPSLFLRAFARAVKRPYYVGLRKRQHALVPTLGFKLLYALVIARLDRRELVWLNVTSHPTAEWIAQQITEAFPWGEAPGDLIRDNDGPLWFGIQNTVKRHGHS